MNLKSKLLVRSAIVLPLVTAVLFLPAGSLKFWQGWVFLAIMLGGTSYQTVYLYRNDPLLLERRLRTKEQAGQQKLFKVLWIPLWVGALSLPGLDYRFGWSRTFLSAVPLWLTVLSQALVLGGYLLIMQVLKVNSFASSTIQIESGQKVITTGPYGVVRHPMYSSILLMILFTPLALGSYLALPLSVLLVPVLVYRLIHEERMLRRELPGYAEYCLSTRYRLVPYVF